MLKYILIYIHNVCLMHVAKKKPRRTKSNLSNWRIDQVSKGRCTATPEHIFLDDGRKWSELRQWQTARDYRARAGTRHISHRKHASFFPSLSLSAIPSSDSPHPTFPYSLSRSIPLFSLYSHSPLLFIRVHLPPFRFSPAEIFNFSLVCHSCISSLVLFAIFISQMIFQSILNFCLSMINLVDKCRCWSWNGENVRDRRRRCAEGLRRCR